MYTYIYIYTHIIHVYIYIYVYIHTHHIHIVYYDILGNTCVYIYIYVVFLCETPVPSFGRGDDTVGNPHRAQNSIRVVRALNFSIGAFRACPPAEIRQTAPCRAIRGNSISVNSKLHMINKINKEHK